jgi:hypothetical protein
LTTDKVLTHIICDEQEQALECLSMLDQNNIKQMFNDYLYQACRLGHAIFVAKLMSSKVMEVESHSESLNVCLGAAAKGGHTAVLFEMFKYFDRQFIDYHVPSIFYIAAVNGNDNVIRELSRYYRVNGLSEILMSVCKLPELELEVLEALLDNAEFIEWTTAFSTCCSNGRLDLVCAFLEHEQRLGQLSNAGKSNALCLAVIGGHHKVVKELILTWTDFDVSAAFLLAVAYGNLHVTWVMLKYLPLQQLNLMDAYQKCVHDPVMEGFLSAFVYSRL